MKAIKLKTINSCWRKPCLDVVRDFTGFLTDTIKEIMKQIGDMVGGEGGDEGFQGMDPAEVRELTDTASE